MSRRRAARPRPTGGRPDRRAARAGATALLALLALATPTAHAQAHASVEWRYATQVGAFSVGTVHLPLAGMQASVLVDAEAALEPVTLTVLAQPTLLAPPAAGTAGTAAAALGDPGFLEAAALLRTGPVDVRLGLLRLPLETARLSLPYQLDGVTEVGQRHGWPGAEATVYLERVRLRARGWWRDSHAAGAFSARLDLTSLQLEAHLVRDGRWGAGVGASGLLGDTVLYGEAWLIGDPWRGRGAVGASGYLGEALWTVEAAWAPPYGVPGAAAYPQLLAQADLPLPNANGSLQALAGAGWAPSTLRPGSRSWVGQAALTWAVGDPAVQLEVGPSVRHDETGTSYLLRLSMTAYSGF